MANNENTPKDGGETASGPFFTSDSSVDEPTEEDCRKAAWKERTLVIICVLSITANIFTTWFTSRPIAYPAITLAVTWIVAEAILRDDSLISEGYVAIYFVTIAICLLDGVVGNIVRSHYGF
jgi:hypothetical protein